MQRIRIFISSVQSEFAQERAMLNNYIRTDALLGKFFETFIFEDVPANEASPQQVAFLPQKENMILLRNCISRVLSLSRARMNKTAILRRQH